MSNQLIFRRELKDSLLSGGSILRRELTGITRLKDTFPSDGLERVGAPLFLRKMFRRLCIPAVQYASRRLCRELVESVLGLCFRALFPSKMRVRIFLSVSFPLHFHESANPINRRHHCTL